MNLYAYYEFLQQVAQKKLNCRGRYIFAYICNKSVAVLAYTSIEAFTKGKLHTHCLHCLNCLASVPVDKVTYRQW